ncbi:MAG: phosphatidylserine decarboxylase [Syntrophales bacterium]|nr:phosphatidylserine decarboxylase [Syntrophales bacterium]
MIQHQYIDRESRKVLTEDLYGNDAVRFLYSGLRENAPFAFRLLTSAWASKWLGYLNYESFIGDKILNNGSFLKTCGINGAECLEDPRRLDTIQKVFERKIRYWECRPMPKDPGTVVSPADSRMLYGSLSETSSLFIKGKFFDFEELIGKDKKTWLSAFHDGDFAVFRLTPEKYHYNHTPVSGKVVDFYSIMGAYHSCNPHAVLTVVTPYSKNKRIVTIFDTDVPGGTNVGVVAMIEVVALMIGGIVQCYSKKRYNDPVAIGTGMFVEKGLPKSLFRPGSSTVVLMFEKNRLRFADDIVANMSSYGVESIFSQGFGRPMVETDVKVRSLIGSIISHTQEGTSSVQ